MKDITFKKKQNQTTRLRGKGEVPFLSYTALEAIPWIRHGFSTRYGGVSEKHLGTMNLSFSRGDEDERVKENFRRFSEAVGVRPAELVFSVQTHTTNIRRVDSQDKGKGIYMPCDYTDVDGLITNEKDVCLATFYADCVPLYFVDPEHRAIGLSHSGWKGTAGRIGAGTVERMKQEFGTDPQKVIAAIGPSICIDCYEVSEDVAEVFFKMFAAPVRDRIVQPKANHKYQLDLWEANYQILLEAGVLPEHISRPDLCTCCNPEHLFSHRASKGKRGNLAALLCIK